GTGGLVGKLTTPQSEEGKRARGLRGGIAPQLGQHGGRGALSGEQGALDRGRVAVVAAHEQAVAQAHRAAGREARPLVGVAVRDAVRAEVVPPVDLGAEPLAELPAYVDL